MASGHDPHDDHGHDDHGHDDHGHDDHGHDDHAHTSGGDLWVVPPIAIGLVVAVIIVILVGGTGSGASPFG